mgnify:CR=1 FL=1
MTESQGAMPQGPAVGASLGSADVPSAVAAAREELATLDRELAEIELLIGQARTEAGRHEARRAQAEEELDLGGRRARTRRRPSTSSSP